MTNEQRNHLKAMMTTEIFASGLGYGIRESMEKAEEILEKCGIVSHETSLK